MGFLLGTLMLIIPGSFQPVEADHANTGCGTAFGSEITKENNDEIEDGNHADILVTYPDGGPVSNGVLVKSLYLWANADNWAEVGWNWRDGIHTSPRRFWARTDGGRYGEDANDGDGGTRGQYSDYKVDNDTGQHFRAFKDQVIYHTYTFDILSEGEVYSNAEVDNSCDSSAASFRNL